MSDPVVRSVFQKLFEHNDWANRSLLDACRSLGDEQLDAAPDPVSSWSIRFTFVHLAEAQQGYLALLTKPLDQRRVPTPTFVELRDSLAASGAGLLALLADPESARLDERRQTMDGYLVEPWVALLQAINHATEHRRQIATLFRLQGLVPPRLDGWRYGELEGGMVPVES